MIRLLLCLVVKTALNCDYVCVSISSLASVKELGRLIGGVYNLNDQKLQTFRLNSVKLDQLPPFCQIHSKLKGLIEQIKFKSNLY